jgi:recombination protein RecA
LAGVDDGEKYGFFGGDTITGCVEEFVSTGCLAVDRMLGGGWPVGAISECRGWEHSGKSVLLDQSMAYMQSIGGVAALLDSEKSRDKSWTKRLGVDIDKMIYCSVDSMEDVFIALDQLIEVQENVARELNEARPKKKKKTDATKKKKKKKKLRRYKIQPPPMLVVWDSLGATPTRAELEGSADDKHVSPGARVVKRNFRRLTQKLYRCRMSLVFANHMYMSIGPFATTKSYGGSGVRFHTHVRVELVRTGNLTVGSEIVGHQVEVKPKKNRIMGFRKPAEAAFIHGAGFDNTYTLFNWGLESGWITRSGAWAYLYPPGEDAITFQRQFLGLGEILRQRPELYQAMVAGYMAED